jgi:rhodanese-related sulfurtransferase
MVRTILRSAMLTLALAAPLAAGAAAPFQDATIDQVGQWIAAKDAVVFDVNPAEVFAKNHLPGALFVSGKQWTKALPPDKGTRLVFYCANPR